jgi:hypothetical protein
MTDSEMRLDCVVALAIKNNVNPHKNNFPAFTRQVLASKFAVSQTTMNSDIKTLISAWRTDRWKSIIWNNPYKITREEIDQWEQNYKQESCIT